MNVIVGASGQVGSNLISEIKRNGFPVRAVVRDPKKIADKTIETRTADLFNAAQLTEAFKGGSTVFVLTPENPASDNIIEDTKRIVENYRKAVLAAKVERVIALSCIGAQIDGNTGNVLMSGILERGFDNLDVKTIFIRPSYYFSNWLGYLDTAKQYGVLPTFFPEDLKIEMHSPVELAKFIAKVVTDTELSDDRTVFELVGRQKYSSLDVAGVLSKLLNRKVVPQTIPQKEWQQTLLSAGFTESTAKNLSDMTQAVIDKLIVPENPGDLIKLPGTLENYMEEQLG